MKSIFVIFNESGEVRVDPNDLGQVEALLCDFDVVPEVDVIDSDGQESSRPLPSTTIPSSPTSGSDSRSSPTHDSSPILPLDVEPRLRARPRVNYKSLNRFGTVLNVSLVENIVEPTTVREALETDLSDLWEEAMKKELESIYKHETWEVAIPPRDAHPITTKWVFTIKRDSHGQFRKCKARLVVRGFQQLRTCCYSRSC
jgi:hypothetical protein